jgi:hypothetical protein
MFVGLNAILREAWNTAHDTEDKRERIQALSLAKECYSMKLDLLTNAAVIDDATRFVTEHLKRIHEQHHVDNNKEQQQDNNNSNLDSQTYNETF